MSGGARKGNCSNPSCDAHHMHVAIYTAAHLCRDCHRAALEQQGKLAPKVQTPAEEPKRHAPRDYRGMSQVELREFVEEMKRQSAAAKTREEKNRLDKLARRARAWLPPRKCAAEGCEVIVDDGNEYCSSSCAGKAAANSALRFAESRPKPRNSYQGFQYLGPKNAVSGQIDAMFDKPAWSEAIQQPFYGA